MLDHGLEGRVQLVPADLSIEGLPGALAPSTSPLSVLDSSKSTFVVAEGLLMYFEEARVRALLMAVANFPAPKIRLVMTSMERD